MQPVRRLMNPRGVRGHLKNVARLWLGPVPDPDVTDDILADRIRSEIGPLEKRLDVPRVHVMVHEHIAVLHGAVPTLADAAAIETAVSRVSGVRGVESFIHIGLGEGSTRPSEGRSAHRGPSEGLTRMLEAVRSAGVPQGFEERAVRIVASLIFERISVDEREQMLCHLPADLRALAEPPRRHGAAARIRTVDALATVITRRSGLSHDKACFALHAVMSQLKEQVPEEAHDVAATLPKELRLAWESA